MGIHKGWKVRDPISGSQKSVKSGVDEIVFWMLVGPGVGASFVAQILQITMTKSISKTSSYVRVNGIPP
jgi:hypothetical protein